MIKAENLCKRFGSVQAIENVSFEINEGEIVGFLGSNAAGKTTTMRILTCYFPATSGSAMVAGYDVFKDSLKVRRNVGYLPENVPLYLDMPVEYFLNFAASLKGIPGKLRKTKVEYAIERCKLQEVSSKLIGNLSKGFRQRVGIAQAIINDPPVLILDEPTVGLDPKQIIDIRNLIKSFGGKSTVILSTHILHEIEKVCDRILIIDRGKILAFDTIEKLSESLRDNYSLKMSVKGNTEKAKKLMRNIEGVFKIHDLGKQEGGIYNYRLIISKDIKVREQLSDAFCNSDYSLIEMYVEPMSAEDIFRKIVPDKASPIDSDEDSHRSDKKKKQKKDKDKMTEEDKDRSQEAEDQGSLEEDEKQAS